MQHVVTQILQNRILNAISLSANKSVAIKTVVLAGGVAANQYIRNNVAATVEGKGLRFIAPPINLCGDNAAMIAWAGVERYKLGLLDNINFVPRSRWSLEAS